MNIRLATIEDKDEIMALYRSHIGEEGVTWDEDYPNEEIFLAEDLPDNLYCLVDGGVIAAVVSIEDDVGANEMPAWDKTMEPTLHIARVGVRHGYEGRGLARQLISHVMEVIRSRGMKSVRYLVGADNLRAQRAYAPLGFTTVGEGTFYGEHWLLCEKAFE